MQPNIQTKTIGFIGLVFGLITVFAGGVALFGGAEVQKTVGDAVPFVLWFNFLMGFVYMVAGSGLIFCRDWAVWLSAVIATATAAVLLAFSIHVLLGGAYEARTAGALVLRLGVWLGIFALVRKQVLHQG